jgi:hypothetical protein
MSRRVLNDKTVGRIGGRNKQAIITLQSIEIYFPHRFQVISASVILHVGHHRQVTSLSKGVIGESREDSPIFFITRL